MHGMQLKLRKFDPSQMKDTVTIVIIGKRNTGKSVLAKDIMFHKRHLPAGVVMSATEEGNAFYGDWVPNSFIYDDFDRSKIEDMMELQRKALKTKSATNVFLILDDCMYDKRLLKEKCMRKLFMNGRHYKMFVLLTAQYCGDLPPDIRSNIDYVFVLRDNIPGNRERLFKNFFGVMPSYQSFCQLMDATTENYECLVLDNTSHSNNLEDNLYWYKAKPSHSFRMGSPALWRFHNDSYDPNFENKNSSKDIKPDPRKPRVKVTKLR